MIGKSNASSPLTSAVFKFSSLPYENSSSATQQTRLTIDLHSQSIRARISVTASRRCLPSTAMGTLLSAYRPSSALLLPSQWRLTSKHRRRNHAAARQTWKLDLLPPTRAYGIRRKRRLRLGHVIAKMIYGRFLVESMLWQSWYSVYLRCSLCRSCQASRRNEIGLWPCWEPRKHSFSHCDQS